MTKLLNKLRRKLGWLPAGYHIEMHPEYSKLSLFKNGILTDYHAYYRKDLFSVAWSDYDKTTSK